MSTERQMTDSAGRRRGMMKVAVYRTKVALRLGRQLTPQEVKIMAVMRLEWASPSVCADHLKRLEEGCR